MLAVSVPTWIFPRKPPTPGNFPSCLSGLYAKLHPLREVSLASYLKFHHPFPFAACVFLLRILFSLALTTKTFYILLINFYLLSVSPMETSAP